MSCIKENWGLVLCMQKFGICSVQGEFEQCSLFPPGTLAGETAAALLVWDHRIIESLELEGSCEGHLFQPPCSEQGHHRQNGMTVAPWAVATSTGQRGQSPAFRAVPSRTSLLSDWSLRAVLSVRNIRRESFHLSVQTHTHKYKWSGKNPPNSSRLPRAVRWKQGRLPPVLDNAVTCDIFGGISGASTTFTACEAYHLEPFWSPLTRSQTHTSQNRPRAAISISEFLLRSICKQFKAVPHKQMWEPPDHRLPLEQTKIWCYSYLPVPVRVQTGNLVFPLMSTTSFLQRRSHRAVEVLYFFGTNKYLPWYVIGDINKSWICGFRWSCGCFYRNGHTGFEQSHKKGIHSYRI